jgi:predicted DNA-binding protein (UPF0251 family)
MLSTGGLRRRKKALLERLYGQNESGNESLFISMPRPKKCRKVAFDPAHRFFKPQGIPISELDCLDLGLDELEALRIADLLGLYQNEGARMMNISQPTFNRILSATRGKVADSLVNAHALRIESTQGHVTVSDARGKAKTGRQSRGGARA